MGVMRGRYTFVWNDDDHALCVISTDKHQHNSKSKAGQCAHLADIIDMMDFFVVISALRSNITAHRTFFGQQPGYFFTLKAKQNYFIIFSVEPVTRIYLYIYILNYITPPPPPDIKKSILYGIPASINRRVDRVRLTYLSSIFSR